MRSIEVEAKTVEEAIALACAQLQTAQENLGIEVLEHGPGRIFSMFSGRKARIRAAIKDPGGTPPDAGAAEKDMNGLLELFTGIITRIDANARIETDRHEDKIIFNIIGDGSGIFIGKKGQTLEALQYLINKMRARQPGERPTVLVDSEGYRSRHIDNLEKLALRLGDKAKKKGAAVTSPPLNAADRRIIHLTLKPDASLTTWSKGDGSMRKVVIAPRQ